MINIPEYKNAERVFYYFEEISKIPHGSHNTSHIADYLVNFANEHKLFCYRDAYNNVVIKKKATKGLEDRPTVIIQGHTDMVAEKLPNSDKDMSTEGLELYRDGDFLRARGTTLGGDDGVAVAYALALLESADIPHPAIEALFTSDEEIGLIGASALDTSVLDGKIMINIDSDDEGIFTVGCAGGARVDYELAVSRSPVTGQKYKLTVSGLMGGHSGMEIGKGRGNAIKLLAEALSAIGTVRLASISGGNADNAIPRECTALFVTESDIDKVITDTEKKFKERYKISDSDVTVTLVKADFDLQTLDEESTKKVLGIINDNKSGVVSMSADIEGLVESSQNLGIVRLEDEVLKCTFSVRSSKASAKSALVSDLGTVASRYGADISVRGEYPAWEYKKDSKIRDIACKVYSEMYGKEAEVIVIHAGLECGIFSDKIEGLDCISLGPDNYDIHTTEEHLSISSTARVYEFLKIVLAEI